MNAAPLRALAAIEERTWLVGGALRDRLLGRPTADYDVATARDPRQAARALARAAGGHSFELSKSYGVWRVLAPDRTWQVDLLPLAGKTIEADLRQRDFTVNAMAEPLSGGALIDPFGGLRDLQQCRLRMVSESVFPSDPLRALRLIRIACELGFQVDPQTRQHAARSAAGLERVAPERVFFELKRILISERALDGLAMMDELTVTDVVLPELTRLRGVEQSSYHHLDVHEHTRAVLSETIALERDPRSALGECAAAADAVLSEPLANELTRWQALRLGALLHDVAKPNTREVTPEGRITFIGHDWTGAEIASAALRRLRASDRLCEHVALLARHHLRLGFLVHDMPLSRADIYGYLRACSPVQVDVTVLSIADRLATRGRRSDEAIAKHLELARQLMGEALRWRAHPPRPPVRGDEIARELGVPPGPELGRILDALEEESFVREMDRAEAITRARELLSGAQPAVRDR